MRIGFAGTPPFAAAILRCLIDSAWTPQVVLTQPDRASGRGRKAQPGPVKALALEQGIPLRQPSTLKGAQAAHDLAADRLDVLIVVAYGLILPATILTTPRLGCLNVHASLLPRWRGAAPIERALLAGDTRTGVCIMQMDEGLDTGPVHASHAVDITPTTTGPDLEAALATAGLQTLLHTLSILEASKPVAQSGASTYAHKLGAADSIINWRQSAQVIDRQVRAMVGRAPAYACSGDLRVRVYAATLGASAGASAGTIIAADKSGISIACGSGSLVIHSVQLNRGKGRRLSAAKAINGYPELFTPGRRFDPAS
ncbi:MAG: methionyl-tRNA formyltransferase [Proteobacteria bacterium]|nr:methionyl-tRNA formyltransferase [Pseudomonadota bacterium]